VPRPLVIITGASSGIGAATAGAFAKLGHPLLLLARRRQPMEALGLADAICIAADVTDRQGMQDALRLAETRFGPPDLLVNNAGIMPLGRILNQDPLEWQRLYDVNCIGLLNLTQLVLPGMIERRHGTVVNIGSVAGRSVYKDHMAYCGTKFAVHAMTEQIRREVAASSVRMVVVAPGMVETPLLEGTTSAETRRDYLSAKASMGGAIDASSIADAITYIYGLPQEVCIRELVIAPTRQEG
jgi:NADP-dependent 3-hydroxy acid dehydrogenase YdfG